MVLTKQAPSLSRPHPFPALLLGVNQPRRITAQAGQAPVAPPGCRPTQLPPSPVGTALGTPSPVAGGKGFARPLAKSLHPHKEP